MESPFGLNLTQMSKFLDKFSLDTHNIHVGNAMVIRKIYGQNGHGHWYFNARQLDTKGKLFCCY